MMPFFNRNWAEAFSTGTGLERVGAIGPVLDCWRVGLQAPGSSELKLNCCSAGLQALGVTLLCKNKEDGGSARASPVTAPMPKSVSL